MFFFHFFRVLGAKGSQKKLQKKQKNSRSLSLPFSLSLFLSLPLSFPQGYREKIWDHAPGALLVLEAGGSVSDAGGAELDFGKGRWLDLDRGIVTTASKMLHRELIEALKPGGAVGDA